MIDAEALRRENAELRAQLSAVLAQLVETQATNTKLTEQIATLSDRVAELLAVAQRRQRKPTSETKPAPSPAVDESAWRAFEARPKPPEKPPATTPSSSRPPPTGRKPVPAERRHEI